MTEPLRNRLSDYAPEDRAEFVGRWCHITDNPDELAIYEGAALGGKVRYPLALDPIYTKPENIFIHPELPRAFTKDGLPPSDPSTPAELPGTRSGLALETRGTKEEYA
ncbi:hypothetical protein [Corynebacterium lipophiloflavum]|uniref:Uncharacterized protein n=1 Tax=Corynebacterium lipophiloflavum (strain ATCC 700352 / DSM 44291 / CCUG 37336 / JCM 10383 / DMMZ 1944) TaxID=525263 RepID=C0XTZ4_CORLD|nr:hypothetical protein [Corynebacterium lipophiloflavum]EEI16328.1 hypothetical protein HMPREF0298_1914 [Corynebacterium lipophiloflavum DSM 44291]